MLLAMPENFNLAECKFAVAVSAKVAIPTAAAAAAARFRLTRQSLFLFALLLTAQFLVSGPFDYTEVHSLLANGAVEIFPRRPCHFVRLIEL